MQANVQVLSYDYTPAHLAHVQSEAARYNHGQPPTQNELAVALTCVRENMYRQLWPRSVTRGTIHRCFK